MVVMTSRARTVVPVVALALAASLLTLAVVLAKPAQAQASTVTSTDRIPASGVIDGCPPSEPISVEGTLKTVAHTTIDANGGYHTTLQIHLKGQGVGLDSGDKYVYNQLANHHLNATGPSNETSTFNFKIIRQGSVSTTDDANATAVFHVTVNANGEVTTQFDRFEDECT
jgi:hypothetical protein